MARAGMDAVAWASKQVAEPSRSWEGWCLMFVRSAFGVSAVHPSAEKAWYATERRRGTSTTPPPGVPVWWTNGRHGHVALSAGGGYVYSNDILRRGKIDKVSIAYITRTWGQTYRGWTEDINGVRVYSPPPPPAAPASTGQPVNKKGHPTMSYAALRYAATEPRLSGWYARYRREAVVWLKKWGYLPKDAPDTDFAKGWLAVEKAIHRRPPNPIPDYYSFRWFVKYTGHKEPDNSASSGAPYVRPDWPRKP